ncbi:aspartate-semialdehyde dehydrogenase [Candidatus Pacearchaeota archaeon CG10_big_fil_rev_8_21_14_0_10_30_48]|nr:MAG: aspartate-semialdehyde dehydrogenase [Candidatus Pacearchaeota archaeon CG10_big_fil_rev_8_21_14_0_10_30_48]
MEKMKVGILGATGMVGQKYISLLEGHPWFKVTYVAASQNSAGKTYQEAVKGRWHMTGEIPRGIENLIVENANDVSRSLENCEFVFSALEMKKEETAKLEEEYAKQNIPVVSNTSAHRWTNDVPMLIPEINPKHIDIIPFQKKNRNFDKGFIVVKPNCSIQSFMTPIYALMKEGYNIQEIDIVTQQALSGAGHPGVSSLDILDNRIPYISGEEEKTEREPLKILGEISNGTIINREGLEIYSQCNRDNVTDGHTACVKLKFSGNNPSLENIIDIWKNFKALPQELELPFAPKHPIIYREELDRPQPKLDRDSEDGMAVSVGRLRIAKDKILFIGLSHNTIRGAAGGGILNAELLYTQGYFKF